MSGDSRTTEGTESREAEWQFEVPDRAAVEHWLGQEDGSGVSVGAPKTLRLADLYYDTGDWRLWQAGYALRVRTRGKRSEATLKSLAEAGTGGLRRRREISETLFSSGVEALKDSDGPVGVRLRALAGNRRLSELFEVRTRRLAHPLSGSDENGGRITGELALDETGIPLPDSQEPVLFDRIEVEVGEGGTGGLESFVSGLQESCGLVPASSSKFGLGLDARGLTPPGAPDLGPENVDPELTLGEVAYAVMRRQFVKFLSHEPGVRLGEDPEEVHDMRVASRRLRAALQVFEPALPEKARRFEPELKHFAAVLGEVRDLDVQLEQLETWLPGSPEEDRESLRELRAALLRERESARERMLSELDSRRYERLLDTFPRTLRLGPPRRNRLSDTPVTAAAPALVRRSYKRVRKAGDGISRGSPAEDYHGLRKRCKRLRYLVEFLEEVYGGPASKLVKRLKPLQDVLGDIQDADVARERLRWLASEPGDHGLSHAAAFTMGGLEARYAGSAAEQREDFPEAYSGIKGKPWKRLDKALQKAQKSQKSQRERRKG